MDEAYEKRQGVYRVYSSVAEHPAEDAPFPVGRDLAAGVGYPRELLDALPASAVEAFAGVSCVSVFADIPAGATVLDLGCGGGLDTLAAAWRTGPAGRVIGVDFSEAMLERARCAVAASGCGNVELRKADAESLPLDPDSADMALVNGIFNLNPFRDRIFSELCRVLRPGGTAYVAELVLREPLPEAERHDTGNWFTWVGGARESGAFLEEFRAAGFRSVTLRRTLRNARTKNPRVLAAEVEARK